MIREKTVLIHITRGQVAARRWHNSEPSPKRSHLLRRAQTTISGWQELKVEPSEKALLLHSVLKSLWKANVALRGQPCSLPADCLEELGASQRRAERRLELGPVVRKLDSRDVFLPALSEATREGVYTDFSSFKVYLQFAAKVCQNVHISNVSEHTCMGCGVLLTSNSVRLTPKSRVQPLYTDTSYLNLCLGDMKV